MVISNHQKDIFHHGNDDAKKVNLQTWHPQKQPTL